MANEHDPLAAELIRAVEQLSECFANRSVRYALVGELATTVSVVIASCHCDGKLSPT
jgi:hypothetical protein